MHKFFRGAFAQARLPALHKAAEYAAYVTGNGQALKVFVHIGRFYSSKLTTQM